METDGVVTFTVRMLKMSLRDTNFKALWLNLGGKLAAFLTDERCLSEATSSSAHLRQAEASRVQRIQACEPLQRLSQTGAGPGCQCTALARAGRP